MNDKILLALVSVASAALGFLLKEFLARQSDSKRFERDNKRDIYGAFLSAIASLTVHKDYKEEIQKANIMIIETKFRIGLYGSKEVIQAIAEMFKNSNFNNVEGQRNLTKVVAAMRSDTGMSVIDGEVDSLHELLFNFPSNRITV